MPASDRLQFRRAIRRALNQAVAGGRCSVDDHAKVLAVLRRPKRQLRSTGETVDVLLRWRDAVAARLVEAGIVAAGVAIPWETIWQYIVEHWDDILRLLIAILVLVI